MNATQARVAKLAESDLGAGRWQRRTRATQLRLALAAALYNVALRLGHGAETDIASDEMLLAGAVAFIGFDGKEASPRDAALAIYSAMRGLSP